MNPWSFYEHKPQLIEAIVVGVTGVAAMRQPKLRGTLGSIAAKVSVAWAAVGLLDYLVYSFGYSVARWGARDVESVQLILEWLRVPIAGLAAVAVYYHLKGDSASREPPSLNTD